MPGSLRTGRPVSPEYLQVKTWAFTKWDLHRYTDRELEGMIKGYFTPQLLSSFNAQIPPLSTIHSWIREWKRKEKTRGEAPKPVPNRVFHWQEMRELEIPWEASAWIASAIESEKWSSLVVRRWCEGLDGGYLQVTEHPARPNLAMMQTTIERHGPPSDITFSGRQVRWWWHVHLLAPGLDSLVSVALGNECYRRETAHLVLGESLDLSDVVSFCAYQQTEALRKDYEDAKTWGLVRQLEIRFIPDDYETRLEYITEAHKEADRGSKMLASQTNAEPNRYEDMEARRSYITSLPRLRRRQRLPSLDEANEKPRSVAQRLVDDFPR